MKTTVFYTKSVYNVNVQGTSPKQSDDEEVALNVNCVTNDNLQQVNCKLNGQMQLDTGAACSIIPASLLTKLSLIIKPTDRYLTFSDGSKLEVVGSTTALLEFGDKKQYFSLVAVNSPHNY